MAIRNIVPDTDEILHKKCRPITEFNDKLKALIKDMEDTLDKAQGVGLAGPQVGMLRRIFVLNINGLAQGRRRGQRCSAHHAAQHPMGLVNLINGHI